MLKIVFLIIMSAISFLFPTTTLCKDSLHKAAYRGDIELVNKILKSKINPDERDSFGGTALHAAMFQKNTEIITILINHGFDVNAQGLSNGYTPLHDAVWANNLEAVIILIKRGARTDIRGKDGLTPYEKALKENKKEIAEYFKSKGSDLKGYDQEAKTSYSENDVNYMNLPSSIPPHLNSLRAKKDLPRLSYALPGNYAFRRVLNQADGILRPKRISGASKNSGLFSPKYSLQSILPQRFLA